jgi:hypothetical protein
MSKLASHLFEDSLHRQKLKRYIPTPYFLETNILLESELFHKRL